MSWKATLQPVVTMSATKTEYMAIAEVCKKSVQLKSLFAELCGVNSCIDILCDSQSVICLTKDQMFHERTKHIDVKYHYVRDVISQGKLKVCKISTHDNPADMMTKPVLVAKFEFCSNLAGLTGQPKKLFGARTSILCCVQVMIFYATRRNLSQGGVCYIVIQILVGDCWNLGLAH